MFFIKTLINFISLIHDYIDSELNDEEKLQQQLFEIRLKYEMDEISEEEYEELREKIVQRIRSIRERKMESDDE